MIGFHSGMPGARNDSGPFSQSANDAMAGPWLNSSSFQVGRSAFLGSVCGVMRVQKALRIARRVEIVGVHVEQHRHGGHDP